MAEQRIAVIDYGMGNLHSAASALEHVAEDAEVVITSENAVIESADRVVFPGVGAIRDCMHEIRRLDFDELILKQIQEKPVLAICVGMQALMNHSKENQGVNCIGAIDGEVEFFGKDLRDENGIALKVPHMGWNQVHQTVAHPMWRDIPQDSRFYFVHSYYVRLNDNSVRAGVTRYGLDFVSSAVSKNLFCAQFHPEKSHSAGLQLLANFTEWDGNP